MLTTVKSLGKGLCRRLGYRVERIHPAYPVARNALDPAGVEILADGDFQASCREVAGLSLLDVPRLANLWQLCRQSNPRGGMIEVGTYKGGGALHLSNCCPGRPLFVCDSFTGFEALDPALDGNFEATMFRDTGAEAVRALFTARGRTATVIEGFFPESCAGRDLGPVSFAHLDVDLYKATLESLNFLDSVMIDQSLIILDDYRRNAAGVDQAVSEFLAASRRWVAIPMFPAQALLVHRTWF